VDVCVKGIFVDKKTKKWLAFEVNPSTPQHKCWGLLRVTLSGASNPALKGGAWRRRMGQKFVHDYNP